MSLPSRERGLKLYMQKKDLPSNYVAPFAGAWIEIAIIVAVLIMFARRSLRGSVD